MSLFKASHPFSLLAKRGGEYMSAFYLIGLIGGLITKALLMCPFGITKIIDSTSCK